MRSIQILWINSYPSSHQNKIPDTPLPIYLFARNAMFIFVLDARPNSRFPVKMPFFGAFESSPFHPKHELRPLFYNRLFES